MPTIIGGAAAMVALLAGVFAGIDPIVMLGRAALAFMLGWVGGQVWQVLLTVGRTATKGESAPHAGPLSSQASEGD